MSSSSAPARAAVRSHVTSRRRASGSCCSNVATGCRASSTTGSRRASSSRTATSRRTPGTTRRARRSSRRSTTSSAARRSSTAQRSIASARRTSASSATTTASHPPGRSLTTSSSPTTRSRSSFTRCTAPAARTRPRRTRARRIRFRRSRTSRASSSSQTISPRPAITRSTRRAESCCNEANTPYSPCIRCDKLRRLPMPGAREVRRRGARRAARARARERHAPDERARRQARNGRGGDGGTNVVVDHDGETERFTRRRRRRLVRRGELGQAPAHSRRTTSIRTASPTAPTRSGGTTCSTRARQCSLSRARRTRPSSRRRLRSTTSTSAGGDFEYPLGNIQMIGKSQAQMFRGEKPLETKLAPEWTLERIARHAIDFWLSTEDLPLPENRVTVDGDGRLNLSYKPTNDEPKKRLLQQARVDARQARHEPRPPDSPVRVHEDTTSRSRAARTRPARFASASTRRRRRSTSTARRTSSTTSTSSTRASSRASAP